MKSLPLFLALALVVFLSWRAGGTAEETRLIGIIAAGAIFVVSALFAAARPAPAGRRAPSFLVPGALLLAAAAGVFSSPVPAVTREAGWELAAGALLLASLVILPPPARSLRVFAAALSIWAVALVAYGVLKETIPPLHSTFVNRNHFCAFLGIVLPLALAPALGGGRGAIRSLWGLLSAILAGGMVLTRSRGGLAALFFTLLFFWGWERQRRGWRLWPVFVAGSIAIILLAAILAVTAGFPIPHPPPSILYPPPSIPHPLSSNEISVSTRISLMASTISLFLARPIFGWGWGSFPFLYPRFKAAGVWYTVSHAHNEWLEIAAEGGIVGLALIAFALALLVRRLGRSAAEGSDRGALIARGAAGSLVYAAIHANVEFIFRVPAVSLLLAAIGGAAIASYGGSRMGDRGWRMGDGGWRRAGLLAAAAGAVVFLILPAARACLAERSTARGFRLLEKGRLEPAAACFSRAHDLDRSAYPPLYGLARTEIARFHQATDRTEAYERIAELLDRARERNPWDARTEWTRAAFLARLGDGDGAEAALRRARALDPSNPFFSLELARRRLSRRDERSAAALLRRAAADYPPIWPAALALMVSRVENYSILRELPPDGAAFRRDLIYALLARRRTAEARDEAVGSVRANPGDPAGWLALGRAAAGDGRLDEARDAYRRALALDPDDGPVWSELGDLHLRRGETEEGLRCFLASVAISPGALGPSRSAGSLLLSQRGPAAALSYWDLLGRRRPDWGYPHYARAEILLDANDREGAEAELAQALRREPENTRYRALQRRLPR